MSWQAYSDALVADPNVSGAAITGFPDGGLWCATDLALQGTEGAGLCARMSSPGSGASIVCGGISYMATNCTEDFLTGRKGSGGICVTKSGKALLVCVYGEGMNAGSALDACTKMADDLTSKGF